MGSMPALHWARMLRLPVGAIVVQEALRTLILLREQAEVRPLRGKLHWEGNLDEQRTARLPEQ